MRRPLRTAVLILGTTPFACQGGASPSDDPDRPLPVSQVTACEVLERPFVVVGENDHRDPAGELAVAALFEAAEGCGHPKACLFLEAPADRDLSACVGGFSCYQALSEAGIPLAVTRSELFEAIEATGARLVPVDLPGAGVHRLWEGLRAARTRTERQRWMGEIVEGRNQVMAETLLASGCDSGIADLGAAHVVPWGAYQGAVPDLLEARGWPAARVIATCMDGPPGPRRPPGIWFGRASPYGPEVLGATVDCGW